MKKLVALVLCLMLALGCMSFASAEFAPVSKDELKVGFVFIGDVSDKGYTYAHGQGVEAMKAALGLSDEHVIIKTNVPEDGACENAIRELIEQGCQIIYGNSYGYMNYMEELAEEYPEVIFSHCSGYKSNDVNFNNYFGAIYQARYLSGIAAGMKTKSNKIGFVAAMQTPEVIGGFDAFALGVQSVNPDAVVYVKYTNSWYDPTLERQTADALLDMGCDVIAQHCDTANPQIAAQERGVWGCGYNADMSVDAPAAHLTAPVWNWDVYYKLAIQTAMECESADQFVEKMGGPAYYGGLNEGMVDVSPLSENCAAGTQDAIDQVKALIASGEWDVFSGVKLNITVADGKATIEKVDAPLVTSDRDEVKDDQVVVAANTEIVPAGGPSVEDSVITGSMNYLVKGVVVA